MKLRTRKLVGTMLLMLLVPVYLGIAALVAVALHLHPTGPIVLAYSAFFGLAWTIPAALLIRWMVRPDPEPPAG